MQGTRIIKRNLFIGLNDTWSLKTYGKIENNLDIPDILNPEKLHELLDFLSKASIGIENCDYYAMIDKRTAFRNYQEFKDTVKAYKG